MFMFTYVNQDINFTESYIQKRGWRSTITLKSVLNGLPYYSPDPSSDQLKELQALADDLNIKNVDDALSFWLAENCLDRWDKVGRKKIEFESAADAMAYKLTWL